LHPDIGRERWLRRDAETKSEFSATHDVGIKLKKVSQNHPSLSCVTTSIIAGTYSSLPRVHDA
jgi:hypothetical protein